MCLGSPRESAKGLARSTSELSNGTAGGLLAAARMDGGPQHARTEGHTTGRRRRLRRGGSAVGGRASNETATGSNTRNRWQREDTATGRRRHGRALRDGSGGRSRTGRGCCSPPESRRRWAANGDGCGWGRLLLMTTTQLRIFFFGFWVAVGIAAPGGKIDPPRGDATGLIGFTGSETLT